MPAQPRSHKDVQQILSNPNATSQEIASKINADLALAAHVLKMANSAVFASAEKVRGTIEAVKLIGTMRLRALVSTAWAFQFIEEKHTIKGFDPKFEAEHGLNVALEALKLAEATHCPPEMTEDAFTAALVHDLGKFLMAVNIPEVYAEVTEEMEASGQRRWQIENAWWGFNHAHIGATILENWRMADSIIDAVRWHHEPERHSHKELTALTLVHLANCSVTRTEPNTECVGRLCVLKMRK